MEILTMMKSPPSPWLQKSFAITLFFSALTGFGQMPIYKRYYLADLPGLGWLAQFYLTYLLHYVSAIILMAIIAYAVTDYLLRHRRSMRITIFGYLRGAILTLIIATGVLLVFRNFPGHRFSPLFVMILDFSHLGLVMVFIITTVMAKVFRQGWRY
jgi:hypothetical protein